MASQKPTFKEYNQNQHQILMLPPLLDESVPEEHSVRVVNDVINKINILPRTDAYQSKGYSSYHPQMLLKILVYGYLSNTA